MARPRTGRLLEASPLTYDFGSSVKGSPAITADITLFNFGDQDTTISAVTISGTGYSLSMPTIPFIVGANGGDAGITVSFDAAASYLDAGTYNSTLTIRSNAANAPTITVAITGVVTDPTTPPDPETIAITVAPASINFGRVKAGDNSADSTVIITNTGEATVTITGIVYAATFSAGATGPTPGPLPQALTAGQTLTFSVKWTPVAEGFLSVAQGITVESDVAPDAYVALSGTAYLIDADSGGSVQAFNQETLIALWNGTSAVIREVDQLNIDSEEPGQLERVTNYSAPGVEKSMHTIFIKYEDLGPAKLAITVFTRQQLKSKIIDIGTVIADGAVLQAQAQIYVEGEIVDIIFWRDKDWGPISIIEYILKYDEWSVLLGTYKLPTDLDEPAGALAQEYNTLFAFIGTDDVVAVRKIDAGDRNTEEDCVLIKRTDFGTKQFENCLMRVAIRYEDLGPATLTFIAKIKRNQQEYLARRDVQIGTKSCDGWIRSAYADMQITGEIIEVSVVREAENGPVSILDYGIRFDPRGEFVGENL